MTPDGVFLFSFFFFGQGCLENAKEQDIPVEVHGQDDG